MVCILTGFSSWLSSLIHVPSERSQVVLFFCHSCFQLFHFISPHVKLGGTEVTLHHSSSHIYLLNSTGDKVGQHCIISVIQTGNDVSKTHGVTSSTIESRQHALPYNCFVLDLINSVVACRVHFLDFHAGRNLQEYDTMNLVFYITSASCGSQYFGEKVWMYHLSITREISGLKICYLSVRKG